MTPKEKAVELLNKFVRFTPYSYARQCAILSVNEIINSNPHSNPLNTEVYSTMEWWLEVKQELKKI